MGGCGDGGCFPPAGDPRGPDEGISPLNVQPIASPRSPLLRYISKNLTLSSLSPILHPDTTQPPPVEAEPRATARAPQSPSIAASLPPPLVDGLPPPPPPLVAVSSSPPFVSAQLPSSLCLHPSPHRLRSSPHRRCLRSASIRRRIASFRRHAAAVSGPPSLVSGPSPLVVAPPPSPVCLHSSPRRRCLALPLPVATPMPPAAAQRRLLPSPRRL